MLDNVLEHFIEAIIDTSKLGGYSANFERFKKYVREEKEGLLKAAYSAYRERSVGLGAMGFHALLQSQGLPFNGLRSTSINNVAFAHIKERSVEATKRLAEERGEAPDIHGSSKRNAHLMAIAPNASSSIICGGTSPSIEPYRANVFTHKTLSGSYQVQESILGTTSKEERIKCRRKRKALERYDYC